MNRSYYFVALVIIILAFIPLVIRWERGTGRRGRELAVLAVMTAIAIGTRGLFYMLPQVKPMAAILVITAAAYGAEAGFITGVVGAFISNFLFGQGPWTPWQMLAFGLVGLLSGLFFSGKRLEKKRHIICLAVYGMLSVILVYGPLMDTASVLLSTNTFTLPLFWSVYGTGFVFNVVHGVSTAIFILILANPFLSKLYRMKKKYGVFQR